MRVIGGWSRGVLPPQREFAIGGIGSVHGYAFKGSVGDTMALMNVECALGWRSGPQLHRVSRRRPNDGPGGHGAADDDRRRMAEGHWLGIGLGTFESISATSSRRIRVPFRSCCGSDARSRTCCFAHSARLPRVGAFGPRRRARHPGEGHPDAGIGRPDDHRASRHSSRSFQENDDGSAGSCTCGCRRSQWESRPIWDRLVYPAIVRVFRVGRGPPAVQRGDHRSQRRAPRRTLRQCPASMPVVVDLGDRNRVTLTERYYVHVDRHARHAG